MGYYLNRDSKGNPLPICGKAIALLQDGAMLTGLSLLKDQKISKDDALVCVAENGPFDAAGVVYSKAEMEEFSRPDHRKKIWLLVNRSYAEKESKVKIEDF